MDLSFLLRAERLIGPRQRAQLDFGLLVATLGAHQAASAAARAAAAPPGLRAGEGESEATSSPCSIAGAGWRSSIRSARRRKATSIAAPCSAEA